MHWASPRAVLVVDHLQLGSEISTQEEQFMSASTCQLPVTSMQHMWLECIIYAEQATAICSSFSKIDSILLRLQWWDNTTRL
mmetsp:Transcript_44209/g.96118  ORF Transcript_44209/g.96118 Transcript_44209/m.96118 type:complete len:82 (-) Transcript_44209:224-469(-)